MASSIKKPEYLSVVMIMRMRVKTFQYIRCVRLIIVNNKSRDGVSNFEDPDSSESPWSVGGISYDDSLRV